MERILSTLLIVIALLVSAGGYVWYRYANVPQGEQLTDARRYTDFSPAYCEGESNDFQLSSKSKIYIANGFMRLYRTQMQGDTVGVFNLIYMPNERASYEWFDSLEGSARQDIEALMGNEPENFSDTLKMNGIKRVNAIDFLRQFSVEGVTCRPWWFVDEEQFELPFSAQFSEVQ